MAFNGEIILVIWELLEDMHVKLKGLVSSGLYKINIKILWTEY